MQHIEPLNDHCSGELVSEEEVGHPHTHHREGLDHAIDDAQTVSGEEVIGQAVAGEAFCHSEDKEKESNNPVQFTRLAESASEEHAQHVQRNGSDEEQCGPVVHLSHEQAASHVKRDV